MKRSLAKYKSLCFSGNSRTIVAFLKCDDINRMDDWQVEWFVIVITFRCCLNSLFEYFRSDNGTTQSTKPLIPEFAKLLFLKLTEICSPSDCHTSETRRNALTQHKINLKLVKLLVESVFIGLGKVVRRTSFKWSCCNSSIKSSWRWVGESFFTLEKSIKHMAKKTFQKK